MIHGLCKFLPLSSWWGEEQLICVTQGDRAALCSPVVVLADVASFPFAKCVWDFCSGGSSHSFTCSNNTGPIALEKDSWIR